MKKHLSIILAGALCLPIAVMPVENLSITSFAEESVIQQDGMTFQLRENRENELVLTAYSGNGGDIVIPETVEGYTVTKIGDNVFKENKTIKSVKLPDSVIHFGESVFAESSLTAVNIPTELEIIPSNTFLNCKNLTDIKLHENIFAVGDTAFQGTNLEIPEWLEQRNEKNNNFAYGTNNIPQSENFDSYYIEDNLEYSANNNNESGKIKVGIISYWEEGTFIIPDGESFHFLVIKERK